ncbi:hypothetical protein H5410_052369, partial [Solanum commersonii]
MTLSRLLFAMNSQTRNFPAPLMQYPNNLVRLRCCIFVINLTSLSNSVNHWREGTSVIACDSSDLAVATNNFSLANKIGHGGFNNVYKGVLENGVEIAVKKQDVTLRQGFTEFENEVKLIAKLRHRNLTKLLGYCINEAKKILVYEFMENNSLDKVIFDPTRRGTVTWTIHIVAGNK